jgi:nucleoid-associated protein YgaU
MPKKAKSINYQNLLLTTVKEKYFNLILGMVISLIVSTLVYQYLLRNIPLNIAFKMPRFNFGKTEKKVDESKPKQVPAKTYIVQEGDDLWNIAEKFYGSGFNAYDITVANKLNDATSISAGDKLIIPDVKRREPTVGEVSSDATSQVTFTEGKYIVQPGDSLSIISQKVYGDIFSWPRILQANNLQIAVQIYVVMVLVIPR